MMLMHRRPHAIPPPGTSLPQHSSAPPPQFFSDHRRGEVNELRQLLRLIQSERVDDMKQRDTIRKVIALMTLGFDVSRLFTEMIMACGTTDIVQKKMIYLYLSTYAETNPELALLAVNTLMKDSRDEDPAIRGLALRSLCSLRAPNMVEYVEPAVRKGLMDKDGYVRRTAAMGVLKLWHLSPSLVDPRHVNLATEESINQKLMATPNVETENFVEILFAMLNDVDSQVVSNAISVLNEVLASDGGLPFTKKIAANLLNRIRQFNEWAQCVILNLLSNYVPNSEDELFDILNILEDRIKHSSSAVVLGASKCFIELTQGKKALREPIFLRLKSPFLTLIATASNEIAYVVLTHFQYLLSLFDDDDGSQSDDHESDEADEPEQSLVLRALASDYKLFFFAYTDAVYIKLIKLEVLGSIVAQSNAFNIFSELSEYVVSDGDPNVVRQSIHLMGRIALRYPSMAELVVDQLLSFIGLEVDYMSAPGLHVLRNLLRRSPQLLSRLKEPLLRIFPRLSDPESICAAVWILGHFGNQIEDAPYLLTAYIDSIEEKENSGERKSALVCDTTVKSSAVNIAVAMKESLASSTVGSNHAVLLELLYACLKLFLVRAPEMQIALGRLFSLILSDDAVDFDTRDRALFFYRFLVEAKSIGSSNAMQLLKDVLVGDGHASYLINHRNGSMLNFFEEVEAKLLFKTAVEFNTLSLLFKQPSEKFIRITFPINSGGRFITASPAVPNRSHDSTAPLRKLSPAIPKHRGRSANRLASEHESRERAMLESHEAHHHHGVPTTHVVTDLMDTNSSVDGQSTTATNPLESNDDILGLHASDHVILTDSNSPSRFPGSPRHPLVDIPCALSPPILSTTFESLWAQLPVSHQTMLRLSSSVDTTSTPHLLRLITDAFSTQRLYCVASGLSSAGVVKFYFYGDHLQSFSHLLMELTVMTRDRVAQLVVKSRKSRDSSSDSASSLVHLLLSKVDIAKLLTGYAV